MVKDAGHAFMNQSKPETYSPEIAKKIIKENCDWFKKSFEMKKK